MAKLKAKIQPEPLVPADAPQWAQTYGQDVNAYIAALLSRILALEARLATAGIP